jgi:hypothetical protein
MFTVLQELAGYATIAQGEYFYRRLEAKGLLAHPEST